MPSPLRAAEPADLPQLLELEATGFDPPWSADSLADLISQPQGLVLVATDATAVIAYVSFRRVLDEAELLRLVVTPATRRRGIAAALLELAAHRLAQAGVERLFLEVSHTNDPALALYRSQGWTLVGRRDRYYADGTDALLMRLDLPAGSRDPRSDRPGLRSH